MNGTSRRWQFAWAWVVGATLLSMALACKIPPINPPSPPPTPPPVVHEPVCSPPELVLGCWHQPPGEDWQFIPVPDQPPTPPAAVWNPTLDPAMIPHQYRDAEWTTEGVDQDAKMSAAVGAAVRYVRDTFPERWNDTCLVRGVADIDGAYATVAARLHRSFIKAGQIGDDNNARSDNLTVARTGTSAFELWKLFEYKHGCLTGNPYGGAVRPTVEAPPPQPPQPPQPPPVTDACPVEPCPIRTWIRETLPPGWGDNEIGKSAWKWNARVHTMGNCDSTPVTRNQEPYCRAIGMSPTADGLPRAECPMRPDGHPVREAVENWLLQGGPKRERCTAWVGGECKATVRDNQCDPNNTTNAFAFLAGTGSCRICNTPGDTCSAWF